MFTSKLQLLACGAIHLFGYSATVIISTNNRNTVLWGYGESMATFQRERKEREKRVFCDCNFVKLWFDIT